MQNFNLDTSYAIISAIRAGLNPNLSEDDKIGYDIDLAESVCKSTNGYDLLETIRFIEYSIEVINAGNQF
jgi:ABC-type amino acid transport substrate-binding protein